MMMSSAMSTACQNHIRIIHVRVHCNIACLQTYCTSTYFLMKWIVLLLVLGYFTMISCTFRIRTYNSANEPCSRSPQVFDVGGGVGGSGGGRGVAVKLDGRFPLRRRRAE